MMLQCVGFVHHISVLLWDNLNIGCVNRSVLILSVKGVCPGEVSLVSP